MLDEIMVRKRLEKCEIKITEVLLCVELYPISKRQREATMDYNIRKIKEEEYTLLNDFLYEAIFIPEGVQAPPKTIIDLPELQVYVRNFGKEDDDICFVAEVDEKIIGAVWVRVMNDYGHVEDGIPSLAISLYKKYRSHGIGTNLMKTMLEELRQRGYEKISLSVQKANAAVKLYRKVGYEIVGENEEEYRMVCNLKNKVNTDMV